VVDKIRFTGRMQLVCYICFFSAQLRGENGKKEGASWIRIIVMLCEVQEAEKMTQEEDMKVSSKVQNCDPIYVRSAVTCEPSETRKHGCQVMPPHVGCSVECP